MNVVDKSIVAVVDDDPRILESLESLLASAGHAVRLFRSAETFLGHNLAEIDCLISDIRMSGMDGFQLQQRVKAARPDLPVILITGRHDVVEHTGTMPADGRNVFQKPFNTRDLLEAVDTALRARGK